MTARLGGKTGGRRRGSIDREERKVLTDRMAGDLMSVYRKLGGAEWLLQFAEKNPKEFIQFGLSRLWPAPQKSDDEPSVGSTYNTQVNIGDLTDRQAAIRVSFALARGLYGDPSIAPIDVTPLHEPVAEIVPRQADADLEERRKELLS